MSALRCGQGSEALRPEGTTESLEASAAAIGSIFHMPLRRTRQVPEASYPGSQSEVCIPTTQMSVKMQVPRPDPRPTHQGFGVAGLRICV